MIYVAWCDGFCKIGYTNKDPAERIRELQNGSPHTISLAAIGIGDQRTEQSWHEIFADKRVRGEWFLLDIDDISAIALNGVPDALPTPRRPMPLDQWPPFVLTLRHFDDWCPQSWRRTADDDPIELDDFPEEAPCLDSPETDSSAPPTDESESPNAPSRSWNGALNGEASPSPA